jgi:type II secretory pathway pseudopilin PulG
MKKGIPVRRSKERGVLMVALMAGIAIALILSTVAVQSWNDVSRRDKEAEMMFRAQDLVRALKRFQADKGRLPTELKELIEPGQKGQYFIRRLWKDPLVKGGQWQLLYAAPGGGLFDPSVPQVPTDGGATGLPSLAQTQVSGNDPNQQQGTPPSLGLGLGKSADGTTDPTGMPIAGVKSKCKDRTFRVYKDKDQYSEWVFSIFDLDPQAPMNKQPNQGNQAAQPNPAPANNGTSPFGTGK